MKQPEEIPGTEAEVKRESARRTRRSFVVGGAAAAAGYGLWHLAQSGQVIGRQPVTFRRTFEADAKIMRAVFDERGLSATYDVSEAQQLRLNGTVGLAQVLKAESWRLQLIGIDKPERYPHYSKDVTSWNYEYGGDMQADEDAIDVKSAPGNGATSKTGAPVAQDTPAAGGSLNPGGAVDSDAGAALAARIEALVRDQAKKPHQGDDEAGPSASGPNRHTPGLLLTMDDITKLPQVELITQFKCIEGWSQIVQWHGVRLRDLIDAYPPAKIDGKEPRYVYMETPDGNYYGGYDMSAARHPQSLLVTHMSGQPLTQAHGAPLRLHMPIKYGYKQLKRIGLIAYMDTKPDDYWTKLGYDWYAGL
jgi:hypothetical protein